MLHMDTSAVGHWERGRNPPSIPALEQVSEVLGVTTDWLLTEKGPGPSQPPVETDKPRHETAIVGLEYPNREGMVRDIPVYGISSCGAGDFVIEHGGDPIDYVRRPPGIEKSRDVFCVYIQGDSMSPWFKPGDLIFLSGRRPPQTQSLVVVELKPKHDGDPPPSMFKLLVRRTADYVELQQANPPKTFKVKTPDIKQIYRVLSNAELLGV